MPIILTFYCTDKSRSSTAGPLQDFLASYVKLLGHFYDAFTFMITTELHLTRIRTRNSAYFLENFGSALLLIENFQESVGHHLCEATAEMNLARSLAVGVSPSIFRLFDRTWKNAF